MNKFLASKYITTIYFANGYIWELEKGEIVTMDKNGITLSTKNEKLVCYPSININRIEYVKRKKK